MQISQIVSSRFWGQRKGKIEVFSMFLQSTFFDDLHPVFLLESQLYHRQLSKVLQTFQD